MTGRGESAVNAEKDEPGGSDSNDNDEQQAARPCAAGSHLITSSEGWGDPLFYASHREIAVSDFGPATAAPTGVLYGSVTRV